MTVIIANAEVGGMPGCTVIVDAAHVTVLPPGVHYSPVHTPDPTEPLHFDARGAAVVPGLWDHHVHLRSLVARARSVDLASARDLVAFTALLAAAQPDESGWIRAVGYDDDCVGVLTGDDLDAFDARGIPTRVQHRSGHQWLVNRAARELLATALAVETDTDTDAQPISGDGVIWGDFTFPSSPDTHTTDTRYSARIAAQFNAFGVTGVTDMTPTNSGLSAAHLQRVFGETLTVSAFGCGNEPGLSGVKLVADDHRFPDPDEFAQRVQHARPLPVAIHSVTAETLAVVSWALGCAGRSGDRIEHAFLAPSELREVVAASAVAVGAHPGFIRTHGDRVARHHSAADLASYQPLAAWQHLGVPLLGGTDAPYSVVNPWLAMQAAVDRTTADGRVLGAEWALTPEAAFALFTRTGLRLGAGVLGSVPRVSTGDAPFVALLDRSWAEARTDLAAVCVRGTVVRGRLATSSV